MHGRSNRIRQFAAFSSQSLAKVCSWSLAIRNRAFANSHVQSSTISSVRVAAWVGMSILATFGNAGAGEWAAVTQARTQTESTETSGEATVERPFVVRANLLELPTSKAARRILRRKTSILWEEKPLREGIEQLSVAHGFAFWFDRRLDPSQTVSVATQGQLTLDEIFEQLSPLVPCEIGLIENVVYIGPPNSLADAQCAAIRLHDALAERHRDEREQSVRTRVPSGSLRDTGESTQHKTKPLEIPDLSIASEVLVQVGAKWDMEVAGRLPYDLWHAHRLEATGLATQITLLATGFGLEGRLSRDGATVELHSQTDATTWTATYRDPQLLRLAKNRSAFNKFVRSNGGATRIRSGVIQITGATKVHLQTLRKAETEESQEAQTQSGSTDLLKAKYTLEVQNKSIEAVLLGLASSVGIELVWQQGISQADRQKLVSFQVSDATIDDMLAALATASGLSLKREGRLVQIYR